MIRTIQTMGMLVLLGILTGRAMAQDPYVKDTVPVRGLMPYSVIYKDIGASQTGGGWNYNFRNIRVWLEEKVNYDIYDPNHPYACSADKVVAWRLRVSLPDGSAHILHLATGYNQTIYRKDGFTGVMPDGTVRPNCSEYYGWGSRTGKLTYYTNDGTYLKLEIDADGTSWWGKYWYLYFPDGRRIIGQGTLVQNRF